MNTPSGRRSTGLHSFTKRRQFKTSAAHLFNAIVALAAISIVTPTAIAAAEQPAAILRKISLPPSAELHYRIKAKQSGLTIDGDGQVHWEAGGGKFSVSSESRAGIFGKVLEAKTVGELDQFGLAPTSFEDKRFRKPTTLTTFDRQAKSISFSTAPVTYPIKGGEQDRNSVIWQLIAVARGAGAAFKQGSEWIFFVAGQRDAEPWSFKVGPSEKIRTALGELNAVHIVRAPPPDAKGQRLDIWLAPGLEWYPARLRFTDPDDEFVEQTLDSITKK